MKKICLLCCLLLALTFFTPALAAPGDAILFTEAQRRETGMINYNRPVITGIGGTLYLLYGESIYTWQAGQESPQQLVSGLTPERFSNYAEAQARLGDKADKLIYSLISSRDTLYGLNNLNGKLFPLNIADGKLSYGTPVQLDWQGMEIKDGDYSYVNDVIKAVISDGKVYMLIRDNTGNSNYPAFVCFDLTNGVKKTLDIPFIQDFTPYRDGKLLVNVYDTEHAYDAVKQVMKNPSLGIFDPSAATVTEVGLFSDQSVTGLIYQSQSDTLYYMAPNKIFAMKALSTPAQVAYLPMDYGDDSAAVMLDGGLYAISSWAGTFVRNTDPAFMPVGSLSVYNGYTDQAAMAFAVKYPDMPVIFNQSVYFETSQALAQAMVSGDSVFDVYRFDISYQDFSNLLDKGYCMDLSASPVLTEQISKMYPFLQNAITKDGKYYALPVEMFSYGISYSPQFWKEAGLEDRLPKTFLELIDFMNWWAQEGKEAHPDYILMEGVSEYRSTMLDIAFNLYMQYCQAQGEDLTFNTPLFRKLMAAVESLDAENLDVPLTEGGNDEELYNGKSLLMNSYDWLDLQSGNAEYSKPLPLPLEEGMPVHIPANVTVMFINPNTKNFDMALRYLETNLECMERYRHIMLFPGDNEPVPRPDFDNWIKQIEKERDNVKKQLESAKPEQVKDLEAAVKSYEDLLAKKDMYYWQVSKESIDTYRNIASMCYAATPNLLDYRPKEGESEIRALIARYQEKQISLDQFIMEADKKIRMILLERQ
jgi:outer membrane protein assembly factor BamB